MCRVFKLNVGLSSGHEQLNSINLTSQRSHDMLLAGLLQLTPLLCFYQLHLVFQSVVHLQHQNCQINIL